MCQTVLNHYVNAQTQILHYVSTVLLVLIFKKANQSNLKDLLFTDDKWASEVSQEQFKKFHYCVTGFYSEF